MVAADARAARVVPAPPPGGAEQQDAQWHKERGNTHWREGRTAAAASSYEQALQRMSHSARLLSNRAACHVRQHHGAAALMDSLAALSVDWTLPLAHCRRAQALGLLGATGQMAAACDAAEAVAAAAGAEGDVGGADAAAVPTGLLAALRHRAASPAAPGTAGGMADSAGGGDSAGHEWAKGGVEIIHIT